MKISRKLIVIFISLMAIFVVAPSVAYAQPPVEVSQKVITMQDGYKYHVHTVQRRQTMFSIARAYNIDQQTIIDKNPALLTNSLRFKQDLLIPTAESYKLMLRPKSNETLQNIPPPSQTSEIMSPHTTEIISLDKTLSKEDTLEVVQKIEVDFARPLITLPFAGQALNIAVLMPFSTDPSKNENSADFVEGALLALKAIKEKGGEINIKVLSTDTDPQKIHSLIESGQLNNMHLIIGPVYANTFDVASQWALENKVPIISPLSSVEIVDNPYVVQFAPLTDNKYGDLKISLQNPLNNVVLIRPTENIDNAALEEFEEMLPAVSMRSLDYSRATSAQAISSLLIRDKNNVVLVPANPIIAEEVLSKIAAANAPVKRFEIQTVGTSRWRSLVNMNNAELLFKTNTTYPSSYYADRYNQAVDNFTQEYINNYNRLPSLFSMRGYDVTSIMIEAIEKWGAQTLVNMNGAEFQILQMPYKFTKTATHNLNNEKWVMVRHTPDFVIEVK